MLKAKSGLITFYKDDVEAGIMVTVLVLIGVTILRTGSKPLKWHGPELLYFRSGYM
jgi:hypothetical protein